MSSVPRGRDQFAKFKGTINFLVCVCSVVPRWARVKLFDCFRMTQGTKGLVIRYVLLKTIARRCGDNVGIHQGVYLFSPGRVSVGNNVSIHPMCYIDCTGGVDIGDDVSMAHAVTVMSSTHSFEDRVVAIKDQPVQELATVIEGNVWIGAKATVLAGKRIGAGSVVAAGSVVTKDVTPDTVVAGVPAKPIRKRR